MDFKDILEKYRHSSTIRRTGLYGLLAIVLLVFFFYYSFFRIPDGFKENTTVEIQSGKGLVSVSKYLESQNVISSSFWLSNLVILMGGEHRIVAGDYLFRSPENLFKVANRITHGNYEIVPIRVTIPEGSNIYEISATLSKKFNLFDSTGFLEITKDKEGYLFPDTYFFLPTDSPKKIVALMEDNFKTKVDPFEAEIVASGHSEKEILTMASILEGEAITTEDREIISGILWKRISIGIPLQVDTTFKYINGKSSAELTSADLKAPSPYNTYVNRGLPPTPISNPGLDSIKSALEPTKTDYLYFLSDKDGNMHYAKTLKEHGVNRAKYL